MTRRGRGWFEPDARRLALATLLALATACGGGGGGGGDAGPLVEDLNGDGQALVIAFGDSITRGVGDGAGPSSIGGGYPARLPLLIERDPDDPPLAVVNQGVPGERTTEGEPRLRTVLASSAPDYVILLEGVNDLEDGNTNRALAALGRMVDAVFADGAMPIVGTLTPTCCDHARSAPAGAVANFNAGVAAIAQANSILVVDFHAAFVVPPKTAFDPADGLIHVPEGIHPTPDGYHAMATAVIEAFRAGPPSPASP